MASNRNRLFVILALLIGLWRPDFRPSRPSNVTLRDEVELTDNKG